MILIVQNVSTLTRGGVHSYTIGRGEHSLAADGSTVKSGNIDRILPGVKIKGFRTSTYILSNRDVYVC